MIAVFEPNESDLMNGVYRFLKEKKVINKEKSGVTYKTSYGDPYSFLGTIAISAEIHFATCSEYGTWMLMKLPKPLFITHYSAVTFNKNFFRNWKVEGSVNKASWYTIDDYSTKENNTMLEDGKMYLYDVQHRGKYKYIKLTMYKTSRIDANNAHIAFSGFELFGSFYDDLCSSQRKSSLSCSFMILVFSMIS